MIEIMDTGTGQLIFEAVAIIISLVAGVIGYYGKKFLETNEFVAKYNLNNEKTERILANAVAYAERMGKEKAKEHISKRDYAIKYIDSVSPELIKEYGDKINLMLDRKVEQVLDKK